MSLLKWKELAKSKSELGNKINYVHNAIEKHDIGQQTSQQGFSKVFKPITSKLDDVIDSNQVLRLPRKKRPLKKGEVPDYGIDIEDEVPDMNLGDLFEQPALPQQEKQLMPKPPTYEESLQDLLEGKKEIYVDPQYFPQEPQLPPEYDDDDEIDYGLDDEDMDNEILNDLGLQNYDSVEKVLNQQEMTERKNKKYLNKIINEARFKRNQLKGYKSHITKQYKSGEISEAQRQEMNKRIDNARATLNEYINHYENKIETMKGSGMKKQKGGNVIFFNKPKELIKKLDLIIGEISAGNTSIDMRNMGVSILDTLLKMSTINRSQHGKLYKQYFKI